MSIKIDLETESFVKTRTVESKICLEAWIKFYLLFPEFLFILLFASGVDITRSQVRSEGMVLRLPVRQPGARSLTLALGKRIVFFIKRQFLVSHINLLLERFLRGGKATGISWPLMLIYSLHSFHTSVLEQNMMKHGDYFASKKNAHVDREKYLLLHDVTAKDETSSL